MTFTIIFNSILATFNFVLLLILCFFARNVRDRASIIGFWLMKIVYAADVVALIGGIVYVVR